MIIFRYVEYTPGFCILDEKIWDQKQLAFCIKESELTS